VDLVVHRRYAGHKVALLAFAHPARSPWDEHLTCLRHTLG
jgi:hypothetical protein